MISSAQRACTPHGRVTEELTAQASCPNARKARGGHRTAGDVQRGAEPLRKDQGGSVAVTARGDCRRLGSGAQLVITRENAIKRKIFCHEKDPVIASPGLTEEDVTQLL